MNSEEFKKIYFDEEGDFTIPQGKCVWQSDEIVEHKTVYVESVYPVGDQFFKVVSSWSNSGYWGDGETFAPEVYEVKRVEKTVVVYE